MYRQFLFYLILFASCSVDGQEDTNIKVSSMDVVCDKSRMTVHISFSAPFNGLVYSHGKFDDANCVYVNSQSSTLDTTFDINYDNCGTISDANGRYFENTIVIQYGADILGSDDETKRLRCEWHDTYQTSITQPVVKVSDPEPVVMNFQGDNIDCWMEILEGTTPRSRKVNGIVSLGSPMTLVIAMRDRSNQFDMRVKTCYAHDGHNEPIFLTDERGCILRSTLMSDFKKVRDTSGKANVICYAHFNAFKFPDSIDVYMQCTVEVCRFGCEDTCDDDQENEYGGNFNKFEKTKNANNKKLRDLFLKKLKDFHIQRLKKLREHHLRELRNKKLKDLRNHFLGNLNDDTLSGLEFSGQKLKDQRIKDLQEQRLKLLYEKALKEFEELRDLQELNDSQDHSLKDGKIAKQLLEKKRKERDYRTMDFHDVLDDVHGNGGDEYVLQKDKTTNYHSFSWPNNGSFENDETKIESASFINLPTPIKKSSDHIFSVKVDPRDQFGNQTVAEVQLSSSISVPTANTALTNGSIDVVKGSSLWITNPPTTSIPEERSILKVRKPLMKDRDPMEEEGAMESSVRNIYIGVDSDGKTAMLPIPAEFARWLRRSSRRSIFKRTPPRVKLSLVSKTGRVLMRKYFYPVSPVIPLPPVFRGRKKKTTRHRIKRSTEELGVMKSFKVISSQDLNFDPSITRNEGKIVEGRREIPSQSLCFATTNIATVFGLLSLITICSFTMTGFLFYQYRIRLFKKCDIEVAKNKATFDKPVPEDVENNTNSLEVKSVNQTEE